MEKEIGGMPPAGTKDVRKVIVVYKTHLDIGFTALAADVLANYREDFIPRAVELAFKVNADGQKRFVWTVGSYMVKNYLENVTGAALQRFEQAVEAGYVCWHALPCTTHTELLDEELMRYGLGISQGLDNRYGHSSIAAKMTDVPGHTIAMVPFLAEAGVRFLHLGVNESSRMPQVPPLFCWRRGGAQVVVAYTPSYGRETLLPNGTLLHFAHSYDNMGPPTEEDVDAIFAQIAALYPGAQITAGTLDDFARELDGCEAGLPVVEEEIGDTWNHGIASDPLKVAQCKRLLALKDRWLAEGSLQRGTPAWETLMENLLLVCEHTWGMDCKKHLMDFTHWEKKAFAAARAKDVFTAAETLPQNSYILQAALQNEQLSLADADKIETRYSVFEASHAEQRAYIGAALAGLPQGLREQAEESFAFEFPFAGGAAPAGGSAVAAGQPVHIAGWQVTPGPSGELRCIENPALGISRKVCIGLFGYETYSGKTVEDCYFAYGRDVDENFFWSIPDFAKPGLRYAAALQDGSHTALAQGMWVQDDRLLVLLAAPHAACEEYGCPRQLALEYRFMPDGIDFALYWQGKDAVRSPEALWLNIELGVPNAALWQMEKMGQELSPLAVVKDGNRKLHAVQRLVNRSGGYCAAVTPLDTPLVAFGTKSLYDVSNRFDDAENGLEFLLYNNRWGTNFKQWFEEDMRCAFEIRFGLARNAPAIR